MTSTHAGKAKTAIDLGRTHFDHITYGIRVMGAWLRIDPIGPCLVLCADNADLRHITPCIVPLQTAWAWDEKIGDTIKAELMAADFAHTMGGNPFDKAMRHRVMSAIRARLPDLITMPPEPPVEQVLAGHLIARTEHGDTIEKDVWSDA